MRILVGCEESGVVRDAFLALGHDAWSNDIVPARNGGKHLQMDVFIAMRDYGPWDIIILHPDCSAMALSGNRWYGHNMPLHHKRHQALVWTSRLWRQAKNTARIGCAIENPTSVLWNKIGRPQYIQLWQFGHKEVKKTGILTYNLPLLKPTNVVGPPPAHGTNERKSWEVVWRMAKSPTRKRDRSETRQGVAEAFANQWGNL